MRQGADGDSQAPEAFRPLGQLGKSGMSGKARLSPCPGLGEGDGDRDRETDRGQASEFYADGHLMENASLI